MFTSKIEIALKKYLQISVRKRNYNLLLETIPVHMKKKVRVLH